MRAANESTDFDWSSLDQQALVSTATVLESMLGSPVYGGSLRACLS